MCRTKKKYNSSSSRYNQKTKHFLLERQTDRDRETERQIETERDRERQRDRQRQTDRQTDRQRRINDNRKNIQIRTHTHHT